jgi:hypothetical protein
VRGGLEGRKISPGAGVCVSRQCLHAAALVLAATLLWGPRPALAQGPAQPQAQAPTPPADATATDQNKTGDNKPADAQAADQQGKSSDDQAHVNLPGATVQGKRNAFDENDRKLKELQDSLPCTGCDAKPHTHKKLYKRVLDAVGDRVLPTEAPDHSARDANDKSLEFTEEGNCSGANVKQCVPSNAAP